MKKQMLSIAIYAIIFLALTVAITKSIKVENQQFMTDKVKTMVVNKDGENEFIEGFLNYLGQYVVFVEPKEKEEDRKDALFFREAVYILTIPEGFTDKFLTDGSVHLQKETVPDSIEAISVDNAINNYLNTAKVYSKYLPDMDYGEINTHIANSLGEQTPVTVDVKETDELTYSNGFNMNYFNYLAYVMISCFTTGVSIVMFSFHGLDIRRRHSASPLTSRNMNLQLVFANLMYVLAYMVVFIIAGYILNRDRMVNMNAWLTWLNAVIFALTVLSISYLVGITVKSRRAVQAISTALSLSLSFISGIFVPQQYLAAPVLKVASFTPTFWYVKANTAIEGVKSLGWSELSDIVGYMAIQLGFAAAIISVALVVSKRKRQQAY
jgi:ABC-2 type transport system permease protein